jgi:hypothetical protein
METAVAHTLTGMFSSLHRQYYADGLQRKHKGLLRYWMSAGIRQLQRGVILSGCIVQHVIVLFKGFILVKGTNVIVFEQFCTTVS